LHSTEDKYTCHNNWSKERPTELPPDAGPVSNHLLDIVIKAVYTITPGYGDTLKEHKK